MRSQESRSSGSTGRINIGLLYTPRADDETPMMPGKIELFQGDITTLTADAIVNAANPGLTPGGAVGLAIHRAAGPELKEECISLGRGCHPGDAVITGAYRLSAKYVIHAVGASWHGKDQGESEQLARTYRRCFALAVEHGVRTMAIDAPLKAKTSSWSAAGNRLLASTKPLWRR
jgi:hypothetical protein